MKLVWTADAIKDLDALDAVVRERVIRGVARYALTGQGNAIPLKGRSEWRLRVANWRVIFERGADTVTVLAVDHRRESYR